MVQTPNKILTLEQFLEIESVLSVPEFYQGLQLTVGNIFG